MGRRTPECHVDSQDDEVKVDGGNAICTSIRSGGCYSARGRPFDNSNYEIRRRRERKQSSKDLNLLEERRDMATIKLALYQQQMKRGYDKNIRPRNFQVGDLVLRKVMTNTKNPNNGKLGPNWEGPYRVTSFARVEAYRLEDMDGKPVPRPWNICNLRKYFF